MDYKEKIIALLNSQELSKEQKEKLECIFPELKESEDEKIRKELIEYIKDQQSSFISAPDCRDKYEEEENNKYNSWLAWLEKQGKDNMGISETTKQELEDNLHKALEKETPESCNEFLEKQGEQNLVVVPKFRVGDVVRHIPNEVNMSQAEYRITRIDDKFYYSELEDGDEFSLFAFIVEDNWELVEQKPADKVEPMFKIEEEKWYVCTQTYVLRGKIVVIKGQTYQAEKDNVIKGEDGCLFIDRHDGKASDYFRYWTIQDAKDGDVLCCESGWTCIFKALDNDNNTFSSYCFMDKDEWFCDTGSECHTLNEQFIKAYNSKLYPATKEQRDLLFKKMHEAGYEWCAEKKELKKIEQKSSWSEEDEIMLGKCIDAASGYYSPEDKQSTKDWLNSIKDRVQPQPKQEWSEEDEEALLRLTSFIEDWDKLAKGKKHLRNCTLWSSDEHLAERLLNFLNSLRPQNTWKPSDEQMEALLSEVTAWTKGCSKQIVLESLYNDLKRLLKI